MDKLYSSQTPWMFKWLSCISTSSCTKSKRFSSADSNFVSSQLLSSWHAQESFTYSSTSQLWGFVCLSWYKVNFKSFFSYFFIILRLIPGAEFSIRQSGFLPATCLFYKDCKIFFKFFFTSLGRTKSKLLLFIEDLAHLGREENGLVAGDLYRLRAQPLHSCSEWSLSASITFF